MIEVLGPGTTTEELLETIILGMDITEVNVEAVAWHYNMVVQQYPGIDKAKRGTGRRIYEPIGGDRYGSLLELVRYLQTLHDPNYIRLSLTMQLINNGGKAWDIMAI